MNNIVSKLQHASQTWKHLLATTGGKLEIPKCTAYTLKSIFATQRIPSLEKHYYTVIQIPSSETTEQTTIPHIPNTVPFKHLGVHTTPIGNQQYQLQETVQIKRGCENTFIKHIRL